MKLEIFIALRYLYARKRMNFITIISYLSFAGITIGVAALIVVLSVFNGFSGLVSSYLISLDPHLRIESLAEDNRLDTLEPLIEQIIPYQSISPFVQNKVMFVNRSLMRVVTLKGVDWERINTVYSMNKYIIGRKSTLLSADVVPIYIGYPLATFMHTSIGDTLMIISPATLERSMIYGSMPLMQKVFVAGLFDSQHNEYDAAYIFTNLSSAQRLLELGSAIDGYDIHLSDVRSSPETAQELSKVLPKNVSVKTWYDLHKQLLTVMTIERWVAYILLLLIIIVAVFNILASQTMSVIEKKRDIGILQTMGIERISIKRIFLYQGIISGLAGTLIGFLLGAFVYWLQQEFNIYPLDPTVFKISSLPMKMEFIDFVVVGFASIGLSILAAFIPARRASKIDPLEAIRWE